MKFTKISLVAAMLIGSSAFAIENTKVSGDANLFYYTDDAISGADLFDKKGAAADVAVNLNATTDLVKNDMVSVSAGAGATFLTTLGLENNLVGNTWGAAHTATAGTGSSFANAPYGGVKVENASWVTEAWIAATAGKTTVKLGRMELDTPLAFTEKWSIEKNTFEAAVAINTDIPDTTLVGAYIGNGNGTPDRAHKVNGADLRVSGLTRGGVVDANGQFSTYGSIGGFSGNGAYAVGAINNSFKPLTLQAWYYDVTQVVQAYWLQADLACKKIPGLMAGAQYSAHELNNDAKTSSDVYAFMLGFDMKDTVTLKAAYSAVGDDFAAGFNTATGAANAQSKLYTETFWGGNFGNVTRAGAESMKFSATTPANGIADLGVSYVSVDHEADNTDFQEIAVTASKSFGPLDATVAYVNTDNSADDSNALIAYLTVNF